LCTQLIDQTEKVGTSERHVIYNARTLSFGRLLTKVSEAVLTYIGTSLSEVQDVSISQIKPYDRELEIGMPAFAHTQNIHIPIPGDL
jgi:hypothetical protein